MLRPRPEPLSVEEFEVEQALGGASRRTRLGLLLAPCLSGLWVATAAQARAIDADPISPASLMARARGYGIPLTLLSIGAHEILGTRGLHVVFALLIVTCLVVAVTGRAKRHDLEAKYGIEALRDIARRKSDRQTRWIVAANPSLSAAYEASQHSPVRRPVRSIRQVPLLAVALVFWAVPRVLPYAAILLTALLTWQALKG